MSPVPEQKRPACRDLTACRALKDIEVSDTAFCGLVQGFWAEENSWWPGSIDTVLQKGYLRLRLDSSPMHPEVNRIQAAAEAFTF